MTDKKVKIAIIGGGVAGSSAALYFAQLGLDITLFEKESSLISGPPFCHLHAGGNLYPEISDEQCLTLLKQSIDFLRFYPFIVDYRPTVIALPLVCGTTPKELLPRLELLKGRYEALIHKDRKNKVLGESAEYYRCYEKEELKILQQKDPVKIPKNCNEWMITVAKNIDFEKVQFPLIMVQEYGLNLFRLASSMTYMLEAEKSVTLHTKSMVTNVEKTDKDSLWKVSYIKNKKLQEKEFDYLINAAGFRAGIIDDFLEIECKKHVEFKAAYVSHCDTYKDTLFPEIIFHGKRGTPEGMGQFTPYPHGYFQLHGMTHDITLYEDGLVANTELSCQPKLGQNFIDKIEKEWTKKETNTRTNSAIKHLSNFIPSFMDASVASQPLFGAQQIPGDDPTLRVAEVSFPLSHYARCEIVKVSSVMDMIDAIISEFVKLGYVDKIVQGKRDYSHLNILKEGQIHSLAQKLAKERHYPRELASRIVAINTLKSTVLKNLI